LQAREKVPGGRNFSEKKKEPLLVLRARRAQTKRKGVPGEKGTRGVYLKNNLRERPTGKGKYYITKGRGGVKRLRPVRTAGRGHLKNIERTTSLESLWRLGGGRGEYMRMYS